MSFSSYFSVDGDSDSMSECRGLSPTITEVPGITFKLNGGAYAAVNNTNVNFNSNEPSSHPQSINGTGAASTTTTNRNLKQTTLYQNGFKSTSKSSITTPTIITTAAAAGAATYTTTNQSKLTNTSNLSESCSSSCSSSSSSMTNGKIATTTNNDHKVCDMNGGGCSSNSREYVNGFDKKNGGQGSPLRSQLGLNLKSNAPASNKQSPLQVIYIKLLLNLKPFSFISILFVSVHYVHMLRTIQMY